MRVAECVHVEDIDVRRRHEEVLDEAGEHVPGIEEEEGDDEVEEVRRGHADDEGAEDGVLEQLRDLEAVCHLGLDCLDSDEDGGEHEVGHDDGPEVDHGHVELVGSLGSIAEGKNEAGDECGEIAPFEDD